MPAPRLLPSFTPLLLLPPLRQVRLPAPGACHELQPPQSMVQPGLLQLPLQPPQVLEQPAS